MDLRNKFHALDSTKELLPALSLSCKNSLTAHIQRKILKVFAYSEVKIGKTQEKGLYLPQLSTATSSHLLWIHETGLCTEASQCHQATLQIWEQWETKSRWVRTKPLSPFAWPGLFWDIQVAHSTCSPFLRTASWQQPESNSLQPALSTAALWYLILQHVMQHIFCSTMEPFLAWAHSFDFLLSDRAPYGRTYHKLYVWMSRATQKSSILLWGNLVLFKRCLVTV